MLILILISKVIMDIVPEAENVLEAIDIYCSRLHKRIKEKELLMEDYKDDLDLYIYLNAYRSKIAEASKKNLTNEEEK